MKNLFLALSVFISASAFAAGDGTIHGRIASMTIDNNPALSTDGSLTFLTLKLKDVCPIYPGISHIATKVSDSVALLQIYLSDHPTCPQPRADMTFVTGVDVKYELTKLGLDPATAQVVVGIK